jgi:nucleotide-binding universal stress UspA family protein
MFERILVCLDGSQLAEQILPYAIEQALRFNSKLTLLQVVTMPSSVYTASAATELPQAGDMIANEIQEQESEARAYMDRVAQSLLKKGINAEGIVLGPSQPGKAIVKYAQDNAVDLICIATHGRSGLGRFVFGSVADLVLRESGLPILVIKPKETETK